MPLESWSLSSGAGAGDLSGMSVEALDGSVGTVKDVVDLGGRVHLVVDTGRWIFGKTVVLPAGVVRGVDHDERCVFLACSRDDVKNAPEHDPDAMSEAAPDSGGAADSLMPRPGDRAETQPVSDAASTRWEAGGGAAPSSAPTGSDIASPVGAGAPSPGEESTSHDRRADETPGRTAFGSPASGGSPIAGHSPAPSTERSAEPDRPDTVITTPSAERMPEPGRPDTAPSDRAQSAERATGSDQPDTATTSPSGPAQSAERTGQPDRPDTATATPSVPQSPDHASGATAGARRDDAPRPDTAATAGEQATPRVGSEPKSSGDEPTPSRRDEPSAEATDEGRQDEARPTRRFARDSDHAKKGTSRSTDQAGGKQRTRTSSDEPPIARYDSLTAAEVIARLRDLSQRELATLERYEQRHEGRQTVLSRIESLREDEPWRGYDDATVPEIKRTLADADDARARAVRDYERRHRDRKGVMEAARRIVANA